MNRRPESRSRRSIAWLLLPLASWVTHGTSPAQGGNHAPTPADADHEALVAAADFTEESRVWFMRFRDWYLSARFHADYLKESTTKPAPGHDAAQAEPTAIMRERGVVVKDGLKARLRSIPEQAYVSLGTDASPQFTNIPFDEVTNQLVDLRHIPRSRPLDALRGRHYGGQLYAMLSESKALPGFGAGTHSARQFTPLTPLGGLESALPGLPAMGGGLLSRDVMVRVRNIDSERSILTFSRHTPGHEHVVALHLQSQLDALRILKAEISVMIPETPHVRIEVVFDAHLVIDGYAIPRHVTSAIESPGHPVPMIQWRLEAVREPTAEDFALVIPPNTRLMGLLPGALEKTSAGLRIDIDRLSAADLLPESTAPPDGLTERLQHQNPSALRSAVFWTNLMLLGMTAVWCAARAFRRRGDFRHASLRQPAAASSQRPSDQQADL